MNLTEAELKMAKQPGLNGRLWHGQGLIFDEGCGTLMPLGILTGPKQAIAACVGPAGWVHCTFVSNPIPFRTRSACMFDIVCGSVS